MNHQIFCFSFALLILVAGTSCSTSRLSKNSHAQNQAEIIAQIPTESGEQLIAKPSEPQTPIEVDEPATAVADASNVKTEPITPAVKTVAPAPAIVASSPTQRQKTAALEAEKAKLLKDAKLPLQSQKTEIAKVPVKVEKPEKPTADKFTPDPYFTLFTKTEENAIKTTIKEDPSTSDESTDEAE